MESGQREILGRLVLLVASVFAVLLVGELSLRLLGYVPKLYRSPARIYGSKHLVLLDCFPTNPRGYFDIDLRDPAVRTHYKEMGFHRIDAVWARAPYAVEYRLNSRHFRDAEVGPKRPGVRRVVVLGDSFTEGQGVKEADTYPRRLEALLDAQEPGHWEVRNCARRATDFPALFELFDEALREDPDILVYGMVLNDAERSTGFEARQSDLNDWITDQARRVGSPRSFGFLRPRLVALVQERVQSYRVSRDSTRWYRDLYGEANREGFELTKNHILDMQRRMRERGGTLMVLLWPLLVGLEGGYPFEQVHASLDDFLLKSGIPHRDLLPVLRGRRSESLWVYPVDMHPNEIADRLAAETLAPAVRGLAQVQSNLTR
jgi:hypothetical protein